MNVLDALFMGPWRGGAVFEQLAGMDEQLISLLVLTCAQEQARLCNGVQSSRKRGGKKDAPSQRFDTSEAS